MSAQRDELAKRIIDRVEEIASKGIAGEAVRQVPKGYDYGKHWPIMVAIEMLTAPPVDDVREALAEMFFYAEAPHARWKTGHEGDAAEHLYQNAYSRADDALALVRPRGTGADAEVEAAAQAMFEDPLTPGDYTWAQMVSEDPTRADIWRADARRVLEAAREAENAHS